MGFFSLTMLMAISSTGHPSAIVAFDTDRPSTMYDDPFWLPINVLILMDACMPEIFSCSNKLVVIKVKSMLQTSLALFQNSCVGP